MLKFFRNVVFGYLSLSLFSANPAIADESAQERADKFHQFAGIAAQYYIGWATETEGDKRKEVLTVGMRSQQKDRVVSDSQYYADEKGNAKPYQYRFGLKNNVNDPKWEMTVYEEGSDPVAKGTFSLDLRTGFGTSITCQYKYETKTYQASGTDHFTIPINEKLYEKLYSESSSTKEIATDVVTTWRATYYTISKEDFEKVISFDADGKKPKIKLSEAERIRELIKK